MINAALKSVSVSNFGPFAEKVTFTTITDTTKKEFLDDNTFAVQENRFNKISYIYGANGAGKSNFCKAILQIQNFIALSPILASNNPQLLEIVPLKAKGMDTQNYFKFDKTYNNIPTQFGMEIIIDNIVYAYSFSIMGDTVVSEKLTKKYRRTETILERTSASYSSIKLKSEMSGFVNNISVVKENVLCLSMAAFLNIPLANDLINAIRSIKVVNMAVMRGLTHITEETCTRERMDKYLKVLKIADPTLRDIHIAFNEKKVEHQRMNIPDLEDREFIVRNVQVDVASIHRVYDGNNEIESNELPFLQLESNGTIKLFGILPVIFEALETGSIIIIDEIENGLHPNVVKQIIELFRNKETNPNNSQLICTTHNVLLIEHNVRRDQVWLITKNDRGISFINRISDIPGMRAYENNGQKYLDSAFGDIPKTIFK